MAAHDVPPGDMPRFRAPDPLDAALRGEPTEDPAVNALVADLGAAYLPTTEPERSPALAAFAGPSAGRAVTAPKPIAPAATGARRRARVAVAALVGTVTGKVLLGGAVAAAAVGGLHAAEVVDVPVLPDVGRSAPAEAPAEPRTATVEAPPVEVPAVESPAPVPEVAEDPGVVSGGGETEPRAPAADRATPPPAWPTDQVPSEAGPDRPISPADPPSPKPEQREAPAAEAAPPADPPAMGSAPASEPAEPGAPASGGDAGNRSDVGAADAPTAPGEDPAPNSASRP